MTQPPPGTEGPAPAWAPVDPDRPVAPPAYLAAPWSSPSPDGPLSSGLLSNGPLSSGPLPDGSGPAPLRPRRGRALTWAGVALAAVGLLAAGVVAAGWAGRPAERRSPPVAVPTQPEPVPDEPATTTIPTTTDEPPSRFDLEQSVCVRAVGPADYAELVVVSCGGPHGGQVIHQVELRGPWPGAAGARRAAEAECHRQLESTTVAVEPRAQLSWIYPADARQWERDHGAVICLVTTPSWERGL